MLLLSALLLPTFSAAPASAESVPGPIRFVPETPDSWIRLDARFVPKPNICPARQPRNLHAGYPGILEIGRRADGRLYLVTELDFPRYLKGIAEVPRNWPVDALKAQVVAARTYAAGHMNPSDALARELRYNLCATDACQVYRGLVVERGAWGDSWGGAVDSTAGEILEYNGKPAGAFYFSTSDGRTRTNAEGFGGSSLPYLRSVTENDDTESPVSSWNVRMSLGDLAETLQRAGSWKGGEIQSINKNGDTIGISGGGSSISLAVDRFRNQLNLEAVCLVPKRYPTPSSAGRPLPQVVPSKWFDLKQEGNDVVIAGRGWGHGVGMVQWGAKRKADKGMAYPDILAFYYGGLKPIRRSEPSGIRVGLAIDIEEVAIERIGSVRVEGVSAPTGTIRISGGSSVNVSKGEAISPTLRIEKATTTGNAKPGVPAVFSFEISDPANVRVRYRGPLSGEGAVEPRDRGAQNLNWDADTLPVGSYETELVASDGVDEVVSPPMSVTVAAPTPSPSVSSSPAAKPAESKPNRSLPVLIAALILLMGAAAFFVVRMKRRTARADAV